MYLLHLIHGIVAKSIIQCMLVKNTLLLHNTQCLTVSQDPDNYTLIDDIINNTNYKDHKPNSQINFNGITRGNLNYYTIKYLNKNTESDDYKTQPLCQYEEQPIDPKAENSLWLYCVETEN